MVWWWKGSPSGGSAGLDHILKTGAEEQCGLEALQEATIGIL